MAKFKQLTKAMEAGIKNEDHAADEYELGEPMISKMDTQSSSSVKNEDGASDRIACPANGCIDRFGKPIHQEPMYFLNKDRTFDPTLNPKYANDLGLPSLLVRYNSVLGINHLHIGPEFGGKHIHNPPKCYEMDTLVMVVGAREMNGKTAGARWFGENSPYNRISCVGTDSIEDQILSTTCCGCNTIADVISKNQKINKIYIVTSSDAVISGIENLFQWTKTSFPPNIKKNTELLLGILRGHISKAEAKGIEIKFWKVRPEFITGPTFSAENQLLDYFDAPNESDPDHCHCSECMDNEQYRELEFAKYGMACCDCPSGIKLALKYGNLKKGEKFVLTNNADVTEPTVTMPVDGRGMTFRDKYTD